MYSSPVNWMTCSISTELLGPQSILKNENKLSNIKHFKEKWHSLCEARAVPTLQERNVFVAVK